MGAFLYEGSYYLYGVKCVQKQDTTIPLRPGLFLSGEGRGLNGNMYSLLREISLPGWIFRRTDCIIGL